MSYIQGSGSLVLMGLSTPSPTSGKAKNYYNVFGEIDVQNFYAGSDSCFAEILSTGSLAAEVGTYVFADNNSFSTGNKSVTPSFDCFVIAKSATGDFNAGDTELAVFGKDYTVTYNASNDEYTLTNISGGALYFKIGLIDTTNTFIQLPFTSESFNPSADFINLNNVSLGRAVPIGEKGNQVGDGSLEVELTNLHFPYLMYSVLGKISTWYDGDATISHASKELPMFDIYIRHGSNTSDNFLKFTKMQVNSLKFNFASNAVTTVSLDFNGISYDTNVDSSNVPPYKDLTDAVYVFPTALNRLSTAFVLNGNDYALLDKITSFDLSIVNNLSTDLTSLDGSGRLAVVPAALEVTGSFEFLLPNDSSFFQDIKALDVGSRLIDDNTAMEISLLIDGKTHTINLYNMYITSISHDVNDRGVLRLNVEFKCVSTDEPPITYEVLGEPSAVSPFALMS